MVESGQISSKTQKPFDVFVSHSSKDGDKAQSVVESLEKSGIRCWIAPRNIIPGSQYGESIVEGIENSEIMVLIFSRHANESPQITREVERAVHHGIRIIPFRIEDVPPSKNLEYFISSPHWLDAHSGSFASHLSYLNKTVQHLLGQSGSADSPVRSGSYRLPHGSAEILPSLVKLISGLTSLIISLASSFGSLMQSVLMWLLASLAALFTGLAGAFGRTPGLFPPVLKLLKFFIRQWKAAVGSVLLLFGCFLGFKWYSLSPLENALIGKWQMSIPGVPLIGIPEIHSNGSYNLTLAYQELGNVEIRNGWVYLIPRSGYERRIAWEPGSDSSVTATLVPEEFWNLLSRLAPDRGAEIATLREKSTVWTVDPAETRPGMKRWSIVSVVDVLPWTFLFETGPGAEYRLRAVKTDKGSIKTEGSNWSMLSERSGSMTGDFQVTNENLVSFSTPLGQSTWKRISAAQ